MAFKFNSPRRSDSEQNPPSPFADTAVPTDWGTPAGAAPATPATDSPFFGSAEPAAQPAAPFSSESVASSTRNVLNSDVSVVGKLRFTDDLLVDGTVEGEISSDGILTVGANAIIQAGDSNKVAIRTQSAIIRGKVTGDIVVTDRVELASTAELVGDVVAARIAIQEGAVFIGNCQVGSATVAAAAPKKAAKSSPAKEEQTNLLG